MATTYDRNIPGVWNSAVGMESGLSSALQELINQYNSMPAYTKKTGDQLREQAEGEYKSYYDQLRLSAQQNQERSDLALQQQREGLQRTYDKQREASLKNYATRYSQADRQMLSRGMQRSSYGAQVLANIDIEGAEAQQELWDQQAAAEGNIDAQRTQLAQQLAQQLLQYDAGEAADVLNRIRQLEDQEYERGITDQNMRNQLSTQIYQFMQQAEQQKIAQDQWQAQMDYQKQRDAIADEQWQKQFEESVRQFNVQQENKSSGGSGSGGSSKTTASTGTEGSSSITLTYDDLVNALNTPQEPVKLWSTQSNELKKNIATPGATKSRPAKNTTVSMQ